MALEMEQYLFKMEIRPECSSIGVNESCQLFTIDSQSSTFYRCLACFECFFNVKSFFAHCRRVHCKVLVSQGQSAENDVITVTASRSSLEEVNTQIVVKQEQSSIDSAPEEQIEQIDADDVTIQTVRVQERDAESAGSGDPAEYNVAEDQDVRHEMRTSACNSTEMQDSIEAEGGDIICLGDRRQDDKGLIALEECGFIESDAVQNQSETPQSEEPFYSRTRSTLDNYNLVRSSSHRWQKLCTEQSKAPSYHNYPNQPDNATDTEERQILQAPNSMEHLPVKDKMHTCTLRNWPQNTPHDRQYINKQSNLNILSSKRSSQTFAYQKKLYESTGDHSEMLPPQTHEKTSRITGLMNTAKGFQQIQNEGEFTLQHVSPTKTNARQSGNHVNGGKQDEDRQTTINIDRRQAHNQEQTDINFEDTDNSVANINSGSILRVTSVRSIVQKLPKQPTSAGPTRNINESVPHQNSGACNIIRTGPSRCTQCDAVFSKSSLLKRHVNTCHSASSTPLYSCGVCHMAFKHASTMRAHIRSHTISEGAITYKCHICSAAFNTIHQLKNHGLVHSGERPHKCQTCGATFARLNGLYIHNRIHTGQKPFKCDVCGRGYSDVSGYKSHYRSHTGEKPFKCPLCGTAFKDRSGLNQHKKRHAKYLLSVT